MAKGELGRLYQDGETILRQGEAGECMYVIQEGEAKILVEQDGKEIHVRTAGPGEILGEMSIFEKELRCASVRAAGPVRALTVVAGYLAPALVIAPALAWPGLAAPAAAAAAVGMIASQVGAKAALILEAGQLRPITLPHLAPSRRSG